MPVPKNLEVIAIHDGRYIVRDNATFGQPYALSAADAAAYGLADARDDEAREAVSRVTLTDARVPEGTPEEQLAAAEGDGRDASPSTVYAVVKPLAHARRGASEG